MGTRPDPVPLQDARLPESTPPLTSSADPPQPPAISEAAAAAIAHGRDLLRQTAHRNPKSRLQDAATVPRTIPPPIPLPAARDGLLDAVRDLRRALGVLEAALLDYFEVEEEEVRAKVEAKDEYAVQQDESTPPDPAAPPAVS